MTAQPLQLALVLQAMTDTEDTDMGEPLPIRTWARENGWPTLGSRGPIAYEIKQAWASAYGLPEPPAPERVEGNSDRPPRTRTWAKCTGPTGCGREWKGHDECHCTRCHAHFSVVKNFDKHIVPATRDDSNPETKCVDLLTVTRKGVPLYTTKDSFGGKTIIQLVAREMPQAKKRESEQLEMSR